MSPLNRGPLLGPRMPPAGIRPPPPRFVRLPMAPNVPRLPPMPPMGGVYGPMRQRMPPPRPGSVIRPGPGGPPPPPPPLLGPRHRGPPPLMLPMMGMRGVGPRGPPMRPGPRGILPPPGLPVPHMRPRFPPGNGALKAKVMNNAKKVSKLEELELKKPWMTDEIRSEIQKKNKLYAKAKKNKDAKEWEEFKDLRNKVTRMIRDAKNEYLAKNPEQAALYQDDEHYCDERDENFQSEDEENIFYCEICDREFLNQQLLDAHNNTHQMCGIDGCTFSAHPKLVEKHVTMQHKTGLYSKLKNISEPEDIKKWLNERKRKYPTRENIEIKKSEVLEKQQRGEVINDNNNKKLKTTKKNVKGRKRKSKRLKKNTEDKVVLEEVELYRGIPPFRGIKSLLPNGSKSEDEHCSDDDHVQAENRITDEEEEETNYTAAQKPSNGGLIFGLVADYASDSDNEAPEEVPIKRIKIQDDDYHESAEPSTEITNINSNKDNGACLMNNSHDKNAQNSVPNKDHSTFSTEKVNKNQRSNKNNKQCNSINNSDNKISKDNKNNDNNNKLQINNKNRIQPKRRMLLRQLLSRSIIHERNYINQCVKYIVDNNFFIEK